MTINTISWVNLIQNFYLVKHVPQMHRSTRSISDEYLLTEDVVTKFCDWDAEYADLGMITYAMILQKLICPTQLTS